MIAIDIQEAENTLRSVDPEIFLRTRQTMVKMAQLILTEFFLMSLVLIFSGLFIARAPVCLTVLSLILYISSWSISTMIDPAALVQGLIIKLMILVCLFRAVSTACEYAYVQPRISTPT